MKRIIGKPITKELLHLRSETLKTIEYIKNRMLQFLYYSSLLQAGLILYYEYLVDGRKYIFENVFLASISVIISSASMYFIMKYQKDYQYYLYRSERYLEVHFSKTAKTYLFKPIIDYRKTNDSSITDQLILDKYFCSFKNQKFQQLYLLFNWGIGFMIVSYLFSPHKFDYCKLGKICSLADNGDRWMLILLLIYIALAFVITFVFSITLKQMYMEKIHRSNGYKH